MMKMSICILSILASIVVLAQNDTTKPKVHRSGGFIFLPAKGRVALLSAQDKIPADKLKARIGLLSEMLTTDMEVLDSPPFTIPSASSIKSQLGIDVAFYVIDDNRYPISLIALEERWAMINVAQIIDGNPTDKAILRRFGIELNRVVRSLLCISENGRRPVKASDVKPAPRTWKEIDAQDGTVIPIEDAIVIHSNMPAFGIYPARTVPYIKACREGWAPAPTNEVQKAIWDKVHAVPAAPMKIEFDPKKGR